MVCQDQWFNVECTNVELDGAQMLYSKMDDGPMMKRRTELARSREVPTAGRVTSCTSIPVVLEDPFCSSRIPFPGLYVEIRYIVQDKR